MTEPRPFRTRRRVEFADTDMGGIMHFSRFFAFMESAEHELLRSLDAVPFGRWEGETIGWPRVESTCRYERPARFGEELEILVRVVRVGNTSVSYECAFYRDARRIAHGRTTAVFCRVEDDGLHPVPIPAALAAGLQRWSGEGDRSPMGVGGGGKER
ncbi:MAG TPA: thioesterase family protein [Thermoanaerobaculia bacterium]|nr:thioesterase family protein [Thermoanaerobaculia bacterium]